jgi:hypothetical protein
MLVAGGIEVGPGSPLDAASLASSEPGPKTRPHPFAASWIFSCEVGTLNSEKMVLCGGGVNAVELEEQSHG